MFKAVVRRRAVGRVLFLFVETHQYCCALLRLTPVRCRINKINHTNIASWGAGGIYKNNIAFRYSRMSKYRVGMRMCIKSNTSVLHGYIRTVTLEYIDVRVTNYDIRFNTSFPTLVCTLNGQTYRAHRLHQQPVWTTIPLSRCCVC